MDALFCLVIVAVLVACSLYSEFTPTSRRARRGVGANSLEYWHTAKASDGVYIGTYTGGSIGDSGGFGGGCDGAGGFGGGCDGAGGFGGGDCGGGF